MSISITGNRKADLSEIEQVEEALGSPLPAEFRRFLLEYNGGEPEKNVFDVPGGRTRGSVRTFYGVLGGGESDLIAAQRILKNRLPTRVVSVGEDGCGNRICLSLRPGDYGSVFFWDHELEAQEGDPPSHSNLFKIAESFGEFFEGLKPFHPTSIKVKSGQVKRVRIDPEFARRFKLKPPPTS